MCVSGVCVCSVSRRYERVNYVLLLSFWDVMFGFNVSVCVCVCTCVCGCTHTFLCVCLLILQPIISPPKQLNEQVNEVSSS